MQLPVLDNAAAREVAGNRSIHLLTEEAFIRQHRPGGRLYTNSENAIGWITERLGDNELARGIRRFKDKHLFRRELAGLYPEFIFREVRPEDLGRVDPETLVFPLILKPSVGFFSRGVYRVNNRRDWTRALEQIGRRVPEPDGSYPREVLDDSRYLMEAYIEGQEYAVDAYFDDRGEPVILNILHHAFSTDEDVSDRVYTTGARVMEEAMEGCVRLLGQMNTLWGLRNFPLHMEVRIDGNQLVPIEINPMRFAGWCTTDLAWHAYGINVYEHFFAQRRPDWPAILEATGDRLYSIVVLDRPAERTAKDPGQLDVERLLTRFDHPLEFRPVDAGTYGVYGFLFTETRENNRAELDWILRADLREFLKTVAGIVWDGPTGCDRNGKREIPR